MIKLGRYELVKRLARGGMAELLLARQAGPEGFEKQLVIKRLLPSLSDQEDIVRMFLNEARIAARLTHPNIVQIFDLGKTGKEYFIAMEYVRGRDMRAVQKAADKQEHPIPYELSTYVLSCVCRGLHHAHTLRDRSGDTLGLVHRDVSPHNVLLSFSGDVKLADFGIAKATALAAETQAGVLKGKFAYMSPEQIRGEELDARSDIFSAGILLHELVCWQRLFRRESDFATIRAVESDQIPPPSALRDDVPDVLEHVIMRALERDRNRRYTTAQEMQMDLEGVISELGWRCGPVELASFLTGLFWRRISEQMAVGTGLRPGARGPTIQPLVRRPEADLRHPGAGAALAGQPPRGRNIAVPAHDLVSAQPTADSAVGSRAPGTFSSAQTNVAAETAEQPGAAADPASALLNDLMSAEDAPPTVVQLPDFDDLIPERGGEHTANDDERGFEAAADDFNADLAQLGPPVSEQPIFAPDDRDFSPSMSPAGPAEELIPRPQVSSDRTLHILLVLGIVVSLSLTVVILILIAFSQRG